MNLIFKPELRWELRAAETKKILFVFLILDFLSFNPSFFRMPTFRNLVTWESEASKQASKNLSLPYFWQRRA